MEIWAMKYISVKNEVVVPVDLFQQKGTVGVRHAPPGMPYVFSIASVPPC